MKNTHLIILVSALICINNILVSAKAEDSKDTLDDILQKTTTTILENKLKKIKKAEEVEIGQIMFKVKRTNLWLKEKSDGKKKLGEFAEITLPGKLYPSPKEIPAIEKKDIDRSTIDGTVASAFSANKSGDLNWIVDNFTDKDKEKVKAVFKNKKILEQSKADAQKIISAYVIGQADYKGSVLVFIEQDYLDGRKIKESLACKKTEKGWKITNEFSEDRTFDIVFAALSSGEVSIKGKEPLKEKSAEDLKS